MAESKQYLLPNTQGRYVTVTTTNTSGEVYRINDDRTRTIYADYFEENQNIVLESSTFASEEFRRNLSQNSQEYNKIISSSILQASGQTRTETDPNQPGVAGGSTPTNPNVSTSPTEEPTQSLKYPLDLGRNQDSIMFTAVEYIPPGLGETGSVAGQRQDPKRSSKGTVTLPIQAQINDSNGAIWQEGNLDEIRRMALDTSTKLVKNELTKGKLEEGITGAISEFTKKSNVNQMLAFLAESTVAQGFNIQGRFGGILNPNVELLFSGPTLRPFSFNFRMSPRGEQEAKSVKSIIRFFKKNMAPKRQDGNLFLKAPNTFLIKYQGVGEQGLNKIKECALIDCSVNYTPQGSYMTYEDGTMVSYFMSLTFSEIEPVYDVDYKDNHPIGF